MKKWIALLAVIALTLTFVACSSNSSDSTASQSKEATSAPTEEAKESTPAKSDSESGKSIVIYFSATGNTKSVAQHIAAVTGADTYEILAAQPYTDDDLNWKDDNSRATKEQNDKTVRPEIGSEKLDLSAYDTIYLGYPIWWGQAPRIMDTFVESYDFTGKTVIPFCTSGSSDIGTTGDDLEANAGSGNWLKGKRFAGGTTQAEVEEWLATFQ